STTPRRPEPLQNAAHSISSCRMSILQLLRYLENPLGCMFHSVLAWMYFSYGRACRAFLNCGLLLSEMVGKDGDCPPRYEHFVSFGLESIDPFSALEKIKAKSFCLSARCSVGNENFICYISYESISPFCKLPSNSLIFIFKRR